MQAQSLQGRLVVYYVALGVLTAVAVVLVLSAGAGKHAQPQIAGGYNVSAGARCLGVQIELVQSGQYVDFQSSGGSTIAKLTFKHSQLTGTVACVHGGGNEVVNLRVSGNTLAQAAPLPIIAVFKRQPPTPGVAVPRPPGSVNGQYTLAPTSSCLGGILTIPTGTLRYRSGALSGTVRCKNGQRRAVLGMASGRQIELTIAALGHPAVPLSAPLPLGAERIEATKSRTFDSTVAAFFLAVLVVMLAARGVGALMPKIRQPRVIGEVLAGIALGPTLLGRFFPGVETALFPSDIVPYLGVVAYLGLIYFMFLIGLELDFSALRGRLTQALTISNTSVAISMVGGLAVALPIYELLGPPTKFAGFALFMGVAMSITAFPVLARIIVERRMATRPTGAVALAAAAVDDVTAWFLIALASAVVAASSGLIIVRTVALTAVFCAVMFFAIRPLLRRASIAYDEAGRLPAAWITVIFAAVLLAAYTTDKIGVAVIFGAFLMGVVMPRNAGLTEDITRRVEDFVVTLLLPLFFAYTGLQTNFFLLNRGSLLLITLLLVAVAIVCKFGGTLIAARVTNFAWRDSAVLGTLMNTRGLTELIVLNLALEKGAMSAALFAAMVIMALATTLMTAPLLELLDPKTAFGRVEEGLDRARRESEAATRVAVPQRSVLVAPQSDAALPNLVALARLIARSEPPREVILVRLVRPPRGAAVRGAVRDEFGLLQQATAEVQEVRSELLADSISARAVAFTSSNPGSDVVRLSRREHVDLVLIDGRRPLLGSGVPRGGVGTVLRSAPSDVAVLVAREGQTIPTDSSAAIMVPFGGAEHDWAALELGAWIASASGAPLRLLGTTAPPSEGNGDASTVTRDPTRLLANASLLAQSFVGVAAEPVIAQEGRDGLINAAAGAGLLVIGLSDRWRREGLGHLRSDIARAAPAPILFVRRGEQTGALAARDSVTRFTWSSPGIAIRAAGDLR